MRLPYASPALLLILAPALPAPAQGADGTISGHYRSEAGRIDFHSVAAVEIEANDGPADTSRMVRVVLSEAPVATDLLWGGAFPPVTALARKGELRGVMLEFDPAKRDRIVYRVLMKPEDPQEGLTTGTHTDTGTVWKSLALTPDHVAGKLQWDESGNILKEEMDLAFDAPITRDPVVARLKGPAILGSEVMKVAQQRIHAAVIGDLATVKRLTSRITFATHPELGQPMPPELHDFAINYEKAFARPLALIVREHTATIYLDKSTSVEFVREDGEWKAGG